MSGANGPRADLDVSGVGLTVFGATGYTGALCAAEACRQGLPLRVAGRRRSALEALAGRLRDRYQDAHVEVAVADAADPDALSTLASASRVLLTAVGPYARLGRPVVDAAIAAGCHYVDVSGEVPFVAEVHDQDARAARARVALVPGAGFDGVPGDLLAGLAAARLSGPPTRVRVAYLVRHARVSGGTVRSALGIAAGGGNAWRGGRLTRERAFAARWDAPFPDRIRGTVSVPFPEVVTVARTTGAHEVRAFMALPATAVLQLTSLPTRIGLGVLSRTPAWRLLEAAAERLPEGPSDDARRRTRTTVLVEAEGPGGPQRAVARIDDLYQATARSAVAIAGRLVTDDPAEPGALTPTQAVGGDAPWLLGRMGAAWQLLD